MRSGTKEQIIPPAIGPSMLNGDGQICEVRNRSNDAKLNQPRRGIDLNRQERPGSASCTTAQDAPGIYRGEPDVGIMSSQEPSRIEHEDCLGFVTVCAGVSQRSEVGFVDPEEDLAVQDSIPVRWGQSIAEAAGQEIRSERQLVSHDRPTVLGMFDRCGSGPPSGLYRVTLGPGNLE